MTAETLPEILPVTMLTPLAGFEIADKYRDDFLTGDDVGKLDRSKRRPDRFARAITSRIAAYDAAAWLANSHGRIIHNFGEELKEGHHLKICGSYALQSRLQPGLMLLRSTRVKKRRQEEIETSTVLRLDNLFEQQHKNKYLSVKSGELDDARIDEIVSGMFHLSLFLREGRHTLLFFRHDHTSLHKELEERLKERNFGIIYRDLPVSKERIYAAAQQAYDRLRSIPGLLDGPQPVAHMEKYSR